MTAKQRSKAPEEASPEQYPVSPPPGYRADDHSWTLQTIMEIQKSIGALTQATSTLTDTVQAQGSKLDKISHPHLWTLRNFGRAWVSCCQLATDTSFFFSITRLALVTTCSAPGFLDSGLKVITSTLPRPVRRNRVALGLDSDSRTSPASTARCTSVETRARRGGVPRSFRSSAPTRDSPLTCG